MVVKMSRLLRWAICINVPVHGWREVLELFECFNEIARITEAQIIAHLMDGRIGGLQQLLGPFNLEPCDEDREILSCFFCENAAKVAWANMA